MYNPETDLLESPAFGKQEKSLVDFDQIMCVEQVSPPACVKHGKITELNQTVEVEPIQTMSALTTTSSERPQS